MSITTAVTPPSVIESAVINAEKTFNSINQYGMNFKKESVFALQLITAGTKASDYLKMVAQKNPDSLRNAITNIAAVGISLNPVSKEAYLVPRGNQVCLDISYIGLVKLATDSGVIEWVQAEIVKAKDEFTYNGVGAKPTHKMNPFADRGAVVGVYCVAKLAGRDEFLVTTMSKAECDYIRDTTSQGAKAGAWVNFYEEMLKKTVVKRASKLWPKSARLDTAIAVLNEHEGLESLSNNDAYVPEGKEQPSERVFANIRAMLEAKNKRDGKTRTEAELLKLISDNSGREITRLEDIDSKQIEIAYRALRPPKEI